MHLHPADTTPAISKSGNPPNIAKPQGICKVGMALSLLVHVVDTAYALHNRTNGATVALTGGDMAGRKLFSVSIYPARTIQHWERPSWREIFDFAQANADLLFKPGHALGTWFDDYNQVHVLDVVVLVADRDTALALAFRYGQIAIFDLGSRREIQVSRPSEKVLAGNDGGANA
jgi:hypothetical protein